MKVVFISHSFCGPYFVVGSHHLARQFARRGHSVWHISPIPFFQLVKRSPDRSLRAKRFFQGVIQLEPNLQEAVIRPLLPWQATRKLSPFGNAFLSLSDIGLLVATHPELNEVDVVIIDEPRLSGIENYIRAKAIYYRPTDFYAEMRSDAGIEKTESALLARCRGLIATSEPILKSMLALAPAIPHLLMTNGVDDAFASPHAESPALQSLPRPRVIYVGAIDDRLDLAAIRFLAGRFPVVSFVIIGDGPRFAELQAMAGPNLHVLGPVAHAGLSAYLQHGDVGLLPLVNSRSNAGRSPMKLYEYGLSGLSVLASRTPELDRRQNSFIELYSDHEKAAKRLSVILSSPRDRAGISLQCTAQTWSHKATLLENFIAETSGRRV